MPQEPTVRRKAGLLLPVLVSALVAIAVATGYLLIREPRGTDDLGRWAGAATAVSASPAPSEDMEGAPNPFRTVPADLSGPPTRLRVKAIGVDTALETLTLGPDGELRPPRTNHRAGWYADGTAPGDVGPAVLAGHVDSKRGPAVFYRLRELTTGDRIEVTRGGRTVTFTVTSTAWYPKKAFPTEQVYGPTPDRQLRLITCGGVFDRTLRSYQDNLVVYAVAG
ncbi:class F sortase [Actinoplanes sp. NPDC049599]|uniref:class F sortase n=1 Tax=Actinoplanes sp. NPDC049599 TaxID=3363903 RepID=UPI0037A9C0F4